MWGKKNLNNHHSFSYFSLLQPDDGGGKWVEKIIQREGQKNRREKEGGWRCQKTRGFWVARFRVSKMQCGYINLGVYQLLKRKLFFHCTEVFSSQSKLFSTPAHLCVPLGKLALRWMIIYMSTQPSFLVTAWLTPEDQSGDRCFTLTALPSASHLFLS